AAFHVAGPPFVPGNLELPGRPPALCFCSDLPALVNSPALSAGSSAAPWLRSSSAGAALAASRLCPVLSSDPKLKLSLRLSLFFALMPRIPDIVSGLRKAMQVERSGILDYL